MDFWTAVSGLVITWHLWQWFKPSAREERKRGREQLRRMRAQMDQFDREFQKTLGSLQEWAQTRAIVYTLEKHLPGEGE